MAITHLAYVTPPTQFGPPNWKNRFFVNGGMATFRSGWQSDDRLLVLMGEHGAARKTLHDHTDGTSFMMAAYGDLLLTDTGYYKPNSLANAVTSVAGSHNLILIDGEGAPVKGLLNDWGDADAFIENIVDGEKVAYAEARQNYQDTEVVRGIAFVRQRYFVVADQLTSAAETEHEYRFRLHAFAGRDLDGTVELGEHGPHIRRENGAVSVYTRSTLGPCTVEEPPFVAFESPHVHKLEKDEAHHTVTDSVIKGRAPDLLSVLAPYKIGVRDGLDAPLVVSPIETQQGAAWMIEGEGIKDVAWLRAEGAPQVLQLPTGQTIRSDGVFSLISLDNKLGLLVRGMELVLDDVVVLSASQGEVVLSTE